MKREEAEKLASHAIRAMSIAAGRRRRLLELDVTEAILSAYRKGATEMRERCGALVDVYRRASVYGSAETTNTLTTISEQIRARPLTEDAEEAAYRQQIRDGTEQDQ